MDLPAPETLYRYFDEEAHAKQLCEGYVHLSTFEYIRNCDRARADPAEGTSAFNTGNARWMNGVPVNDAARNVDASGFGGFGPAAKYKDMSGNVFVTQVLHALVLCMTGSAGDDDERFRRVFGQRRVSIQRPLEFFHAVCAEVKRSTTGMVEGGFAPMRYLGRTLSAAEGGTLHPALLGPQANDWELESRMFWTFARPVEPQTLYVPGVIGMCAMD